MKTHIYILFVVSAVLCLAPRQAVATEDDIELKVSFNPIRWNMHNAESLTIKCAVTIKNLAKEERKMSLYVWPTLVVTLNGRDRSSVRWYDMPESLTMSNITTLASGQSLKYTYDAVLSREERGFTLHWFDKATKNDYSIPLPAGHFKAKCVLDTNLPGIPKNNIAEDLKAKLWKGKAISEPFEITLDD